jgi:hypothetical protein
MSIQLTESGFHEHPGQLVIRIGNGKERWLNSWNETRVWLTDYTMNSDGRPCSIETSRAQFEACYNYPKGNPA